MVSFMKILLCSLCSVVSLGDRVYALVAFEVLEYEFG